jgi:hypothetical protein
MLSFVPDSLRPYAKFIQPAVLSVIALVVFGLIEHKLDVPQLEVGLVGLVQATGGFIVTNGSAGLARYAKALLPALLTGVAVIVHYFFTNDWGTVEWTASLTGLAVAFFALITPNTTELATSSGRKW